MVFSVETLMDAKNMSFPVLEQSGEDDISLFENTLSQILEENMAFNSILSDYISENISLTLNKHGLTFKQGLDLGSIIEKIFNWFVSLIDNIGANFKIFLTSMLNKSVQLNAYKHKLSNYRGPAHYGKYYYNYRNLSNENSYSTYATALQAEYSSLLDDLNLVRTARDTVQLQEYVNLLRDHAEYSPSAMDEVRGKILGLYRPITEERFAAEVFLYYRDSEYPIDPDVNKHELNISPARVREAYISHFSSSNQISQIERMKLKLKAEATKQRFQLKSISVSDYIPMGIHMTNEINNTLHSAIVNKCKRVKAICNLYCILFDGKVKALKEYDMMNREILLDAIRQVIRQESK